MAQNPYRDLPPAHRLIEDASLAEFRERQGRETVVRSVREALADARSAIGRGEVTGLDTPSLLRIVRERLAAPAMTLRPVLNATGVLLHTGLGRAPLAIEAIEAVQAVASGYCNLEFRLESGERGRRTDGVEALLRELTGAEAVAVVNNNAGATVLALKALACGREVIVSRGQLIEIGGSFRLPEIFEVSGARLKEVGTTNRTRASDYERAIGPDTAALLRVHPSNYRVVGFTESAGAGELANLAKKHGLTFIDDIGSGALGPERPPRAMGEPTVAESLLAGADVVLGSGDKLLGGPQCGLLIGRRAAIARIESDPLMRALRVDKMTLAALEATLRLALDPVHAQTRIPLWNFLTVSQDALNERAEALAVALRSHPGLNAVRIATLACLGGGSLPGETLDSAGVRVAPPFPFPHEGAVGWTRALRLGNPGVVPRIQEGAVIFDLRAIPPEDDARLLDAIRRTAARDEALSKPE